MKKEVSCRALQILFEALQKKNLPPETLCAGIPYPPSHLRSKHERIEWDVFCQIMNNIRPIWTDEELVVLGSDLMRTASYRAAFVIARLLFNLTETYVWMHTPKTGGGNQFFTCIIPSVIQAERNHLTITLEISPGYQFCREFFLFAKGSLIAVPAYYGLGLARVEMRYSERGATYDVFLPEGNAAMSWLRRTLTWPFAARAAARELKEASEALVERYNDLQDAQEKLQRQATQLKAAYDISRLVRSNLDLDFTLNAIVKSLVEIAEFAGAEVEVAAVLDGDEVNRVVKAGRASVDSPSLTRVLESHGRRIGEIRLWLGAESDFPDAEELLTYVVPTISMEIDGALSFKLVNDYRSSLEQKVADRTQELKEINERLKEAQAGRDRLFSSISHEFRTPLTLILAPIQKWKERPVESAHDKRQRERSELERDMVIAEQNAYRLLDLINQLLDLSKLQSGKMELRASRGNIVQFVKGLVMSYESLAEKKRIGLSVVCDQEEVEAYFDKEKIEKVFNNLLSNAIKFTPSEGRVSVALDHVSEGQGEGSVKVSVADSGIGIPEDKLPHIFNRFYQVDDSTTREQGGSGIGLALAKELVELHHGTIRACSVLGKGSEFIVELPLGRSHLNDDEIVERQSDADRFAAASVDLDEDIHPSHKGIRPPHGDDAAHPLILIVEDNADVRQYIKENLPKNYWVIEATDGADGISWAKETIPDLIISDIMMPKKDGYELCRVLKNDERTSHIPIILLTAKAASENRIEGLEVGADDYIIKPFSVKELAVRVKNLIDQRRKLREHLSHSLLFKADTCHLASLDSAFLQRVMTSVEQHIGDELFTVEQLAEGVYLSRVQLHRKLVALTNQAPGDFIRNIRLQRAMDLLKSNAGTVAEIAYSVGYGDPSHFSTRFHERFGITPGEVRKHSQSAERKP